MGLSALWLAFGTTPFSAREAADAMGVQKASTTLSRYLQEGVLERMGRGAYRFALTPRTQDVASRLLEVESLRQAEFFPQVAGETMQAWRDSGRFARLSAKRYRFRPGVKPRRVRRVA